MQIPTNHTDMTQEALAAECYVQFGASEELVRMPEAHRPHLLFSDLIDSPEWHPYRFSLVTRDVWFVHLGREDYCAAPFLDMRVLSQRLNRADAMIVKVPLDAVFMRIAEQVQLRLVTRERLAQRVDARFERMVWSDALDRLARRHGLAVQVTEDAIYVAALPGAARAAASSAATGAP